MRKSFILIEFIMIIMVIVILGILAAIVVPRYFDFQGQSKEAAEKRVIGRVRAGIHTLYVSNVAAEHNPYYPETLDEVAAGEACSPANPCFINVLTQDGIVSGWQKGDSVFRYVAPENTNEYVYNPATGEFATLY